MSRIHTITGLDIGTNAIKVLVAQKTSEGELDVLFSFQQSINGVKKGVVIDVEEVSDALQSVLDKIQEDIGQKINSVYVNIGGSHIFSTSSHGLVSVSRADRKISEEDINRVLQAAQTFSLPLNKEIFAVFPKEFIIDKEGGIRQQPLGMEGVRLEAEVLVLGAFSPYLKNLTQTVLNTDLQISDIIASPLASSRAVLTPRQKDLGVALLDIGAGTSGLAVFDQGNLIHLAVLPIGSANITQDIAIGLKTDIDIAERIKKEYGSCILQKQGKKEKIEVNEAEPLIFSQKQLVDIIEPRVSEIFGEVNKELKKIGKEKLLPAGIVLTGGGSKLPKIIDLAKKELSLPCRIGKPQGFLELEKDPSLATVCGLVLGGDDIEDKDSGFRGSGLADFIKGLFAKIKKILKVFVP
ncbi:cell division protein FtsA [Candidatus Parcubacteria bacterium]|nr:cell division protein FtsA [Candidatus Parcubacteria bacterium]